MLVMSFIDKVFLGRENNKISPVSFEVWIEIKFRDGISLLFFFPSPFSFFFLLLLLYFHPYKNYRG